MAVKITVQFEGLQETLQRLTEIGEKAEQNVKDITAKLGDDTKTFWKENSPVGKTKRLTSEEDVKPMGLTFTMISPTYYYDWVDKGHSTPRGWHRHRRDGSTYYQEARNPHRVEGQEMTKKATDFVEQNLKPRLSKFLDNV